MANVDDLDRRLQLVEEMVQVMCGQRGSSGRSAVTWNDLTKCGFDTTALQASSGQPVYDQSVNKADSQGPAAPRNLQVQNQYVQNVLTWDNPGDADLYYVEVWRSLTSSRDDAGGRPLATVTIADSQRSKPATYTDTPIDPTKTYYYWIRAVDYAGNYSPWSPLDAQGGYVVPPFPGTDFNAVLDALFGTGSKYQTAVKFLCDAFYVCTTPQAGFPDGKKVFGIGDVNGTPTLGFLGNAFFDGYLEGRMIKAGAVNADAIAAGSIGTEKLAAKAVTAEKIAVGTIIAALIAAGAITADKIAAGAITAEKIAAETITGDKIKAGTLTADRIQGVSYMDGGSIEYDRSYPDNGITTTYSAPYPSKLFISASGINRQASVMPLQILIDGNVVREYGIQAVSGTGSTAATIFYFCTIPAGQHTIGAKLNYPYADGHLEYFFYATVI